MKERAGANHHTNQPEGAEQQSRYRVDNYGKSRNFAAYEGPTIIAVTLYRKGAAEIIARLAEKDGRIAALESQLATKAEFQVFPSPSSPEPVPAPPWTPPRGRVPEPCGYCFGTSPKPSERCQSAGHHHSKPVFKTPSRSLGLSLRTRSPSTPRSATGILF